jgi:cephalosporin hydroxylase
MVNEPHERIPRVRDPETIARMMNMRACRLDSVDDAWHVLCGAMSTVSWRDRKIVKNQFDLARYFHLIAKRRPEIILETGLQNGGSVLFFLDALAMLDVNDVTYVGIDLDASAALDAVRQHAPDRPVMLISADCLADATIREVVPILKGRRSLIVLDSVHSEEHVTEELRLYAPLCEVGSSLVVEDTDHNNRPCFGAYGPAAGEALDKFMLPTGLGVALGFEHDREIETMFGPFTNSPCGWLRRY